MMQTVHWKPNCGINCICRDKIAESVPQTNSKNDSNLQFSRGKAVKIIENLRNLKPIETYFRQPWLSAAWDWELKGRWACTWLGSVPDGRVAAESKLHARFR